MPHRLTTASAPRTARATWSGSVMSHLIKSIWPTVPRGRRKKAPFGWRTATRMRQPALARARTVWRPRKPEPPKTVTRLVFMSSGPWILKFYRVAPARAYAQSSAPVELLMPVGAVLVNIMREDLGQALAGIGFAPVRQIDAAVEQAVPG